MTLGSEGSHADGGIPLSVIEGFANRLISYPRALRAIAGAQRLRLLGAKVGRGCQLLGVDVPQNPWDIELGDGVRLDRGVALVSIGSRSAGPRIRLGSRVYCNRSTVIDASIGIEIGEDTLIGPACYITDHDHGYRSGELVRQQAAVGQRVFIGADVWIGAGVTILKGVKIGSGSVIGAGSIVTRSVEAGAIAVGNPARVRAWRTGEDERRIHR